MKTSSVITITAILLALAALLLLARLDKLESRLQTAETALSTLEPLRHLLSQARPTENVCQPIQATGEPNVPKDATDHVLSWCPGVEDGGMEWLLLTYEDAILTTTIEIHANFNPGSVVQVSSVDDSGHDTELWAATPDSKKAERITLIRLASPAPIKRLKLKLDTSAVPGWNEIDAVALHSVNSKRHWAVKAEASSFWKSEKAKPETGG